MNLAREPAFRLGGMQVRPSTREIVHAGGREVLEPRVMAVLVQLARAKGEVVTRDELTEACWDGRVVSDDAINRVISRIRRVSELTGGKDFTLETITKVGYRLVASGQATEPVSAPAAVAAPAAKARKLSVGILAAVAALIVAIAAGSWWMFGREPQWSPDPKASLTLAVLPFDNLGPSGDDSALAMSMSREIRNTLSRVRGLRVVSDSSSFAVASEPLSATDIGKRLNADLLLDGSLAREGDTVKLSAELVDGWSGVNLWTGSQAGPAADLNRLRELMSAAVFQELVKRIGPNRVEMLATPKPGNPQVYALLLEASQLLESTRSVRMRGQAEEGLDAGDQANALIDQALTIEPNSPLALRLKGQIIAMAATRELFVQDTPVPAKQARAAEYLRRALASDPDNTPALQALGEYYRRFEWRWEEARALMERALALDPNNSEAHLSYTYYLSGAGRCVEALRHARAAIEIDPEFGWRTLGVPRALKCLGRFEESDAAYRTALEQDPRNLFVLREIYLNKLVRRDAAGLRALQTYVRDELWKGAPEPSVRGWLHWTGIAADALEGNTAPFIALIEEDVSTGGAPPGTVEKPGIIDTKRGEGEEMWIQAVEFAVAGAPERAIDMLERSVRAGTLYIPETMPFGAYEFSPEVRTDPRYQAIWKADPRLVELVALRLEALEAGQMQGVLPGGALVTPAIETSSGKQSS
jgi:TolB-like protein/DNA-binding winged helix-turn-helix (wHTH) protein